MTAIKVTFNPNGAGCKHVHLSDDSDRIIEVITEAALSAPSDTNDSHLLLQIKEEVEKLDLSLSDKAEMKTALEAASFDLSADAQGVSK